MRLAHFPVGVFGLCTLLLAACGGTGGAQTADSSSGAGSPTNRPPSISAPASVDTLVGREVVVTPSAFDPDGQTLKFSVTNKPAWLTFNPKTGELRGVPTAADVGRYEKIRITASDGSNKSYVQLDILVGAVADGRVTLTWTAPLERTDGSPLTNLAGFRIYYGTSRYDLRYSVEVRDPGANTWVVEDLTPGTWYFAATAFDGAGIESARTNSVSKSVG